MIKTPLSTMIGGAFWTPSATILGGTSKTFNQIIKSLFANNEQGFVYDPNDLTTMFQDAAGTVPVTGAGQPVGLILDKSKGLVLGVNIYNDATTGLRGTAVTKISAGYYNLKSTDGSFASVDVFGGTTFAYYELDFEITRIGSGALYVGGASNVFNTVGRSKVKVYSTTGLFDKNGLIQISRVGVCDIDIKIHSLKIIAGNHAYQTTSSMRPLLVASPQRLDYDTVDDKLITTLPAQLTGCTVIRSVPNVGTQILTGQTIPTPYNDNTDHCGLLVINRALTPSETSAITAEFNKRAGV